MEQLQITYLLRRGTEERWRRLWQEVAELRRNQFAVACQQAGITRVQVSLLQLLHGELLLVTVQMQEPQQAREVLASSQSPFARWLREQLQSLLGWDVLQVLADPPSDLLFTWQCEGEAGQRTRPVLKERRRETGMTNQEQVDLLKQESAALWNTWREEHPDTAIELSGVDLREANLGEVNLAGADLSHANLREADLNNANLSKASLVGADLSGANLAGADLSDTDLHEANLSRAYLADANLAGANLCGATLYDAHLNWATLEGALITPEQLSQATMESAPL